MWSCSSTCVFSFYGVMMCLPFITTPISHCHVILEWPISSYIRSLISGQPAMMYPFSSCRCSSCAVSCCIYCIDMHSGTFIDVCIASRLTSMACISSSLFSVWLCWDGQSVMKSSGPGMYIILTQYWCILRRMHWICCDRVTTSFLTIATKGL